MLEVEKKLKKAYLIEYILHSKLISGTRFKERRDIKRNKRGVSHVKRAENILPNKVMLQLL